MVNRKRIVAVLLAFLMIFEMLPVTAVAEGWAMLMSNVLQGQDYYSVSFQVDNDTIATQYVEAGKNPVMPENPTKAEDRENNKAYVFAGWYDGDTQITAETTVNSDVNAVAKFDTIGLYKVTVQYVIDTNADGVDEPAANTVVRWYTSLDAADIITSPTNVLEGTLSGTYIPDQASVTINPSSLTGNTTITVKYHTTDTTYKIYHQILNPHYADDPTDPEYTLLGTTIGHGLIGQTVSAGGLSAEEFETLFNRECHYNYLNSTSVVLTGNEDTDYVTVNYEPHMHVLTYNSQGGSYVEPVTKHCHEYVDVYTVTAGTNVLTCGREEHSHTAKPSSTNGSVGTENGCWILRSQAYYGRYWELNCGRSEHSHSDSCYSKAADVYSPTPTRQGYIFDGWYLDAACTQAAPATMQLAENTEVFAKWQPGQADYTVVYWAENVEAEGLYNYIGSVVHTGTVGQTVTAGAASFGSGVFANQQYYHFDSSMTTSAVVKPDGTAVVNAYFMLNEYNLSFNFSAVNNSDVVLTMGGTQYSHNGTKYTFKAKYGQDISTLWPTAGDFSHKTNSSWNNNFYGWVMSGGNTVYASKRLVLSADMIGSTTNGSTTTYNSKWGAENKFELHYMLQNTDDDGYTDSPDYRQHNALSDSDGYNQKDIAGFKKETSHSGNGEVVDGSDGLKHIYFYYTRETYNVDYYYGSTQLHSISSVRFGKSLSNSTFNWTPTTVQAGLLPDYTFAGWYDNIACEGEPYFNTIGADGKVIPRTMPVGNLVLYAKFLPPDRTITLKNSDGTPVVNENGAAITVTVTHGAVPEIPVPVREGYIFQGWYTAPDGGEAYDTKKPLTENITIFAHWKLETITLTIRYWTFGSTEDNYTEVLENRFFSHEALKPGEQYTLQAQYAEGYRPTEVTQPIVLTTGDNYATFYYVSRAAVNYTVKYVLQSDPNVEIQQARTVNVEAEVGRVSEIAPAIITYQGKTYYPTEHTQSLILSADESENVITFQYVPYRTADVVVRYWYPKADGSGYEQNAAIKASDTVSGVRIADSVYAKDYQARGEVAPYVFDAAKTDIVSVTIESEDAGTVQYMDLYYKLGMTSLIIDKVLVNSRANGDFAGEEDSLVFLVDVKNAAGSLVADDLEVTHARNAVVENLIIGETYTVTEVGVKGHGANALNAWTVTGGGAITLGADAAANVATITNTRKLVDGGVTVRKDWADSEHKIQVPVMLYADGKAVWSDYAKLSESNNWAYTDAYLPAYNLEGEAIQWTVKEYNEANGQAKLGDYLYQVTVRNNSATDITVVNDQVTDTIIVSLTDKTRTYDGTQKSLDAATITGGPAGLTLEDLNVQVSGGVGTNVNTYPATITGNASYVDADGVYYTVTYVGAELVITPAEVIVTADDKTKVFGADDPALTATVTGLKGNDTEAVLQYSLSREAGETVGAYPIHAMGEAVQGNYTVKYVPGTLTITGMVVEHYLEQLDGTYKLEASATVGVPAGTYQDDDYARTFTGYVYESGAVDNVTSVTVVAGAAAPVMKLYYNRDSFKVTYEYEGFVPADATVLPAEATYDYGATVTVAAPATATGYVFSGWTTTDADVANGQFTMPANNVVIKGSFHAATNTVYKVEHYLQDTDGNGNVLSTYTLQSNDTETKTGTTGTAGIWEARSYTNYTYEKNESNNEQNGQHIILADGSLVIKVYYTRDVITVTLGKDVVDTTDDAPSGDLEFEINYTYAYDGKKLTGKVMLSDNETQVITLPKGGKLTVDENADEKVWTITGEGEYTLNTSAVVSITNTRRLYDPDGPDGEDKLGEIHVEKLWYDGKGNLLTDELYIPMGNVGIELWRGTSEANAVLLETFYLSRNTRVHTFKNLPAADLNGNAYVYIIKETGAENGKVVHNGYRYSVAGDGVVTDGTVTVKNSLDLVNVVVTKKWVLNGLQLIFKPDLQMSLMAGGVTYATLTKADNTVDATSEDTYTFTDVPYRTDYQVLEELTGHGKAMINGKEANIHGTFEESQTAAVDANFKAVITNVAKKAAITVEKTVNLNGLNVTIPEFTFTVTADGKAQTVTLQPTEGNLTVSKQVWMDIPTGDVTVAETPVTGWTADHASVVLSKSAIVGQNEKVVAAFTNTRDELPQLDITKVITDYDAAKMADELFNFVVTVPADLKNGTDVTYQIGNQNPVTVKANGSFFITGVKHDETVKVLSDLPTGVYHVREEQDAKNHYLYVATTKSDGYSFTVENKSVTGSLILEKRWEHPNGEVDSAFAFGTDGTGTATFGLFTDAAATEPYKDGSGNAVVVTTNPNGDAIFEQIIPGTYYIKELSVNGAAQTNYEASNKILTVEVKEDAEIPAMYTITNPLKRTTADAGKIVIEKLVENVKNEAVSFTIAYRYVLTDESGARGIKTGTIKADVDANGNITYTGDPRELVNLPYGTIVTVTETFTGHAGEAWTTTINGKTVRTVNVVAGADSQTVTVKNTRKLRDHDGVLTVYKAWIDNSNADKRRPVLADYVGLHSHVHAGQWSPSIYGEEAVNADQTVITYSKLPAYDLNGLLLTYGVKEEPMAPYVADQTGYVLDGGKIVNTLYTDLKVTKVWKNVEGDIIKGGRDIEVNVLSGDKIVATAHLPVNELTDIVSVPKYDANGKAYQYSIKEIGEEKGSLMIGEVRYDVEYSNAGSYDHTVTNTKQSIEKTSVSEAGMTVQVHKGDEIIDLVKVGGKITYSIRFGNYTSEPATVTLTDTLPIGLTFVPEESTKDAEVSADGRTITWSMDNVPPRTRGTVTLVAIVNEDALNGAASPEISNTAIIKVGDVEEKTTPAEETIYNPAWTVDKEVLNEGSGANGAFKVGDTINYRITVVNTGNVDLNLKAVDTFTVDGEIKTLTLVGDGIHNPESFVLKVGEKAEFTASYKTEIDDKNVINAVVVEDDDNDTEDPRDEVKTELEDNPLWTVVKSVTNSGTGEGGAFVAGDTVKYSIVVTNTGNIDLNGMTLVDMLKVDNEAAVVLTVKEADLAKDFNLAKDKSITFTAEYKVTATDSKIVNTATATYKDTPVSDDVTTEIGDAPSWKTEKKVVSTDADNDGKYAPGETIQYEITVTNTGNTKLEGLKLEDELTVDKNPAKLTEGLKAKTGDAKPESFTLEEGQSVTFTASYKVKETDNLVSNVAIASKDNKDEPSDPVDTEVEDAPAWTIVKAADKTEYNVGDKVIYTITVKNTGNTTLKLKLTDTFKVDDEVVDLELTNEAGLKADGFELPEGETVVFTATYKKVDVDDSKLYNVVVSSDDDPNTPDRSDDEETPVNPNPKWTVDKTVDKTTCSVGDTVTYTITVKNTGNVDLLKLTIEDTFKVDGETKVLKLTNADDLDPAAFALGKGKTAEFTATYTALETDSELVNFVVVHGEKEDPDDPSDEVTTEVVDKPDWTVVKAIEEKQDTYKPGDVVKYSITVTNTGNTDLLGMSLTDTITVDGQKAALELKHDKENAERFDLKKHASITFTAEYTIQPMDNIITNIAVATYNEIPEESNKVEIEVDPTPAWKTEKKVVSTDADNDGKYAPGETIQYEITVTNMGNTKLEGLKLEDKLLVDNKPAELTEGLKAKTGDAKPESFTLEEGASETFVASYTVKATDNLVENVAVASMGDKNEPSNEVETEVEPAPAWKVEKASDKERYEVGETVTYTVTVTNTGNVLLTGLSIEDIFSVDGKEAKLTTALTDKNGKLNPASFDLAEQEKAVFIATYVVQATDSELLNVAKVGDQDDEEFNEVDDKPAWTVVKAIVSTGSGENGAYVPGDVVKYEITVTNTGNVDLLGMSLTDTQTVDGKESALTLTHATAKAEKFDLLKHEDITFTAEYTITATDNLITNIATATYNDVPVPSNEVEIKVENTPAWTVNKEVTNEGTGANKLFKVGDTVQYKITVANTGNCELPFMTLIDTFEVDSLPEELTLSNADGLNPANFKLAEGESAVFTASYVVEDNDTLLINKVVASDNDPETPDPSDKERTEIDRNPLWDVEKTVDKATCRVGDVVTYTVAVKNTGNVYLPKLNIVDVFLVDDEAVELELTNARGLNPAAFGLAKGATVYFTATYTVQATDSELFNTVIVHDGDDDPDDPKDEVITPVEPAPAWTVTKTIVNTGSGENGAFRTGDTIKYEITVKNIGNVDLIDLTMEDIFTVDGEIKQLTLAPDAEKFSVAKHGSVTFTSSYTIQATDNVLVNTAKVGDEESEVITEIEDCPDYTIDKTVVNTGSGKDGAFKAGDTVIYKIVVTNTGNTDLKNLSVKDTFSVDGVAKDIVLKPDASSFDLAEGKSAEFYAEYKVLKTDLQLCNAVVVTGDEGDREDEVITDLEHHPEVTVKKEVINNGSGKNYKFMVGDKIRYRVTVTNVGNVDLKDLTLEDTFKANGWTKELELPEEAAKFDLVKGETVVFNYSYLIREGDERLVNVATVLDTSDKVTIDVTDDPAASAEIPPAVGYTYNVGDCFD